MVDAHGSYLPRENNFPNGDLYFLQEYMTCIYVKQQKIEAQRKHDIKENFYSQFYSELFMMLLEKAKYYLH
jgi:hypothetical protein